MNLQDSNSSPTQALSEAGESPHSDTGFSLDGVWNAVRLLASHKWLIFALTAVVVAGSVVHCLRIPVTYTATTRIMTPQQTQSSAAAMASQLSSAGGGAGMLAIAARGGIATRNENDIYIALLGARPIKDALIQQFDLVHAYHAKDLDAARMRLTVSTKIVSEKSGLISIEVADRDRQRSADLSNAYTAALRTMIKNFALTEASQRLVFFEDQLKQANDNLVHAEFVLQQIQQKKGLLNLDVQARALLTSLSTLRAQAAAKEVELQTLRSYSTEKNATVQNAEAQLSAIRAQIALMEKKSATSSSGEQGVQGFANEGIEYLTAEHEVQYRQALYDQLLKQYDVARMDTSREGSIIQVVEPAIPSDHMLPRHRAMIVLMSTVIGFLVGCFSLLGYFFLVSSTVVRRTLHDFKLALAGK